MPIIKSTTRKDTNFRQLVQYVFQHDKKQEYSFTLFHNLSGINEQDQERIIQAFQENNRYRKVRKGGVGINHDILSFHAGDSAWIRDHPEALEDIGREYLEQRAPNAIGIIKPHYDKDHIHVHVVYSPNEKGRSTTVRISKQEFQKIRRELERYQEQHYPELSMSYVQDRDKYKTQKLESHREIVKGEYVSRNSVKSLLQEMLVKNMASASSLKDLATKIEKEGFQPYYRNGHLQGILFRGRKYRISTLLKGGDEGLDKFHSLQKRSKTKGISRSM